MCCSVVAACCSVIWRPRQGREALGADCVLQYTVCCSVATVRCGVLRCVAVCCGVLRYVAVRCGVLQCVAVCCGVWQCATHGMRVVSEYFSVVCVGEGGGGRKEGKEKGVGF